MTNQELQDLIIKTFDGIILDEYDREIHRIEGKSYDITFDRSRVEWSCSCPAFRFRRRHKISKCKNKKKDLTLSIFIRKIKCIKGNNK